MKIEINTTLEPRNVENCDNGMGKSYDVSSSCTKTVVLVDGELQEKVEGKDAGFFVRLVSYDDTHGEDRLPVHAVFDKMIGKSVKITIEVTD